MPDITALETALRAALRLMNEHYMALAQALRQEGITLSTGGVWQASTNHFEKGEPIDVSSDPRVILAEELRQARAEARRALGMEDQTGEPGEGPASPPAS